MKKLVSTILAAAIAAAAVFSLSACSQTLTIAVPNDTTNEARALLLLQEQVYIKLADGVGESAQHHLQGG